MRIMLLNLIHRLNAFYDTFFSSSSCVFGCILKPMQVYIIRNHYSIIHIILSVLCISFYYYFVISQCSSLFKIQKSNSYEIGNL